MKIILSLIFFCCFSHAVSAQDKTSLHISQMMQQQQEAWNSGNLEKFMEPYWHNDSLAFVGKSGITYGWQATLDNYKKGYPNNDAMGTLQFNNIKIEKLGKGAYAVLGKWHLKRKMGDVGGYYTLLWKKIAGKWVIVQDHSS